MIYKYTFTLKTIVFHGNNVKEVEDFIRKGLDKKIKIVSCPFTIIPRNRFNKKMIISLGDEICIISRKYIEKLTPKLKKEFENGIEF